MMQLRLEMLGKRYQRHWVFRGVSLELAAGSQTAILGHNGSGKSTLLRILAGMQPPSEGRLSWRDADGKEQTQTEVFEQIAFCAPGMDLPEELTLTELLQFHFSFKKMLPELNIAAIMDLIGLRAAAKKPVADFSSGMKQRVKLAQAIFSDVPLLLLDEPCTNLDDAGVQQYLDWIARYRKGRTIIVASNDEREYSFCEGQVFMANS